MRTVLIVLLILAAIGAIIYVNLGMGEGGLFGGKARKPVVQTATVERRTIRATISARGELVPERELYLFSQVSARIVEIKVREGDNLSAGDEAILLESQEKKDAIETALNEKKRAETERIEAGEKKRQAETNLAKKQEYLRVAQDEDYTNSSLPRNLVDAYYAWKSAREELPEKEVLYQNARRSYERYEQGVGRITTEDEVEQKKNTMVEAQTALEKAKREVARRRQQFDFEVSRLEKDVEEARERLELAIKTLERIEAQVETYEERVQFTRSQRDRFEREKLRILSPIGGRVMKVAAVAGQEVTPGSPQDASGALITVAQVDELLFEAEVDEADFGEVALGKPAIVEFEALGDEVLTGEVVELKLRGREGRLKDVSIVPVRIALELPSGSSAGEVLRPGLTGEAEIETEAHANVIAAPLEAVLELPIKKFPSALRPSRGTESASGVLVLERNNKVRIKPVEVGLSDGTYVEIRKGLSGSETVLTGPYRTLQRLRDGDEVSPEK